MPFFINHSNIDESIIFNALVYFRFWTVILLQQYTHLDYQDMSACTYQLSFVSVLIWYAAVWAIIFSLFHVVWSITVDTKQLLKIEHYAWVEKNRSIYFQIFNVLSNPQVTTLSFKIPAPATLPSCPFSTFKIFQSRLDQTLAVQSNELDTRYSPPVNPLLWFWTCFSNRSCVIDLEWAGIVAYCFRFRKSHILINPSSPAVASWKPLELNSAHKTRLAWPCIIIKSTKEEIYCKFISLALYYYFN